MRLNRFSNTATTSSEEVPDEADERDSDEDSLQVLPPDEPWLCRWLEFDSELLPI
jgi:hypothetical protein